MKRFLFLIVAMLIVASGGSIEAASKRVKKKTKRKVETVEQKVLGKHMCSLQWISWDYFRNGEHHQAIRWHIAVRGWAEKPRVRRLFED